MAHSHSVYDSDPHFVIDPISRSITNTSSKTILMQYDHNSERFSFEVNRLVEGHDITLCNSVQIHYLNADINRQDSNAGVYEVNDLIVDPTNNDRVVFTWLVSNNATLYAGSLSFLIVFACIEDGQVVYRWNTNINTSVSIAKGMNNGESIAEEYPDILAQWLDQLCKVASGAGVIAAGPIEPDTYPYIWLDTSEFVGTADKNVGYLTIKPADGKVQRIYPMVKMGSIEGLLDELKRIREDHAADMKANTEDHSNIRSEFANADNELHERIDILEKILTGAVTAISHSLSEKGVTVPSDMSIQDVSGLIDTIVTDIPTELKNVIVMRNPNKTVYNNGDVFDPTGMEVLAVFTDGVSVYADEKSQSYYPNTMTTGTTSVRVHVFAGSKALYDTVPVTVNATGSGGDTPDTSNTLASLSVGDMVAVRTYYDESNSPVDAVWLVADTDYYGNVLLVNYQTTGEWVKYHNSAPSSAYSNKYDGSAIDWYLKNTYYNAMPTETQNLLAEVDIPVRASANSSTEQNYLSRKVFTLSSVEWGLGSTNYEGEEIEGSHLANAGEAYWTREPVGGMTNTAYYIDENGVRRSDTATVNNKVRAAICMSKAQPITTSGSISYINYDGTSGGGNSSGSDSGDTTKTLETVTIASMPTKLTYNVGDSFDPTGMVVNAEYSDGSYENNVTDYTWAPTTFSEGDTRLVVYVTRDGTTKGVTITVTVNGSSSDDGVIDTLGELSAGDTVYVKDGYFEYEGTTSAYSSKYYVADTDYNGYVLLFREGPTDNTVSYRAAVPNSAYNNKYEGSDLDTYLSSTWYDALPPATKDAIVSVNIPVRSNADSSATQGYLERKVFTLSSTELGLANSPYEGEATEAALQIIKGTISGKYWTREPVNNSTYQAYCIDAAVGAAVLGSVAANNYVRPAFCMAKTQAIVNYGTNEDGTVDYSISY